MRRTGKEILEYCENLLHSRGENVQTLCNATGMQSGRLFMWKSKDTYPRIDTLTAIVEYLGISFDELLGVNVDKDIPDDIRHCENMLLKIPEEDRDIISKIIKIYYEKSKSNS